MDRLGLVAVPSRSWRAFAAPAAFLLAATIAVVVVRSLDHTPGPAPAPSQLPRAATPVRPARRLYSVTAGDTLGAIATKTGVPLVRIRALNPHVAPTSLFIGEQIRLQ
jgi:LysM domain-containing protein